MAGRQRPRWYFSLRSPYSWFAYRELTERFPAELAALEWLPYWEPDPGSRALLAERGVELPLTELPPAKSRYIRQDAHRTAHARGLTMTWPPEDAACWDVPHLGYLAAAEHGQGEAFLAEAYRARWERGMDICEPGVIREIGSGLGLDGLDAAADDPAVRERGVGCLARGDRDGVFGVPFFICGRDKFWGAERLDSFVTALRGELARASDAGRS